MRLIRNHDKHVSAGNARKTELRKFGHLIGHVIAVSEGPLDDEHSEEYSQSHAVSRYGSLVSLWLFRSSQRAKIIDSPPRRESPFHRALTNRRKGRDRLPNCSRSLRNERMCNINFIPRYTSAEFEAANVENVKADCGPCLFHPTGSQLAL